MTLMSNRMFQGMILQMKDATDRVIGVVDGAGTVIACSELVQIGEKRENVTFEINNSSESVTLVDEYTYKALASWGIHHDYAVFCKGLDEQARSMAVLMSVALNGAKTFYDEKHDKATFIKNILLDNILPGDIYLRARELHFNNDIPYVVFLVRQVDNADVAAVDILQNLFPDKQNDFVISINDTDVAVVKRVRSSNEPLEYEKLAETIEGELNSEMFIKSVIGIGTVVSHLKNLAGSYKEAQVAIEVGKVFENEKSIISYENLGIGAPDLSAAHHHVRDVFVRGIQEKLHRYAGPGNALYHQ